MNGIRLVWALLLCALAWPVQAVQTVRYVHTDALGSVVAVTDANRNVIERREYEPYGAQLTPAVADGPGYTGHVQDAATGLVYAQQRYYDPAIGRFLSVDPVAVNTTTAANFCRYCYANNNPYRFTDPDGRNSWDSKARVDAAVQRVAGALEKLLPKSITISGTLPNAEAGSGLMGGAADGGRITLHVSTSDVAISTSSPSVVLETAIGSYDFVETEGTSGMSIGASADGGGLSLGVSSQPVPSMGEFTSRSLEVTTTAISAAVSVDAKGNLSAEVSGGARAGASASTQEITTKVRFSTVRENER